MVLAHARALLTSTPEGASDYVDANLREPDVILKAAARTLDFTRPVALMLMEILGHITDDAEAQSIVAALLDGLSSGSYLVIADGTNVIPKELDEAQRNYDEGGSVPYRLRDKDQIARLFDGTELLKPGVVPCPQWRPEVSPIAPLPEVQPLGGIGRKP